MTIFGEILLMTIVAEYGCWKITRSGKSGIVEWQLLLNSVFFLGVKANIGGSSKSFEIVQEEMVLGLILSVKEDKRIDIGNKKELNDIDSFYNSFFSILNERKKLIV